jgi:hypothetical protein
VAADREVAGVTFAVERTAGILAAETYEVVHEANWPSARGGDVFGTELRQSRLILRTIPRHGSTYLGHDQFLLKLLIAPDYDCSPGEPRLCTSNRDRL